jgi:mannose-6-phosphate isomerase-like protein (cupin superfamily)
MSSTTVHNVTLGAGVAPHNQFRRFRRLVTGVDGTGKAIFVEDGESPSIQTVANTPTFVVTNLWQHTQVPVNNDGPVDDGLGRTVQLNPPPAGSVFRMVEFPPDSDWKNSGVPDQVHATPSLDYAIVLEGEIWAVLDEEERLMKPGEVLIQRGTRHAWSNRSNKPAVMAFVLIGGTIPSGH